jgi:hypothetical protein
MFDDMPVFAEDDARVSCRVRLQGVVDDAARLQF